MNYVCFVKRPEALFSKVLVILQIQSHILRSKYKQSFEGLSLKRNPFFFISWYFLLLEFQRYQYLDVEWKHGKHKTALQDQ